MRRFALSLCLMMPVAGIAEEWRHLSGAEIQQALSGETLDYGGAWQDFRDTGRSLYNAGSDSWGYWQVQDDRYCSQWPPNALWTCYDVEQNGDRVRFIGDHDDISVGTLRE